MSFRVVCVLSGGNIDTTTLARALERGMAAEGRLVKFKVTVSDRPGGMAELCATLATLGVTLRDCIPERAWVKGDVFSVEVLIPEHTYVTSMLIFTTQSYRVGLHWDIDCKRVKTIKA